MTATAAPARPHTRASLAAQLRTLGVRPGAAVLTPDGGREWVWWDDVDLDESDFARLGTDLEATGAVRVGPVGDGAGRLMRQRAAVDFAVDWLARHRGTEER